MYFLSTLFRRRTNLAGSDERQLEARLTAQSSSYPTTVIFLEDMFFPLCKLLLFSEVVCPKYVHQDVQVNGMV